MPAIDRIKLTLVAHNLVPGVLLRRALRRNFAQWKRTKTGPLPHLLKQQTVRRYAAASGARIFIETGTYYGFMLQACLDSFDRLISIELEPHFYSRARKIFESCPKVTILNGDSAELLPELLATMRCSCLFWLDAHFSGGLTGKGALETPIRQELEAVMRHGHRHTVLIDDANCFDGTRGYPALEWIEELAQQRGYSVCSSDDIIRLIPKDWEKSFQDCAPPITATSGSTPKCES